MAASSPAISNNSTDTNVSPATAPATASNSAVSSFLPTTTNASKNLRGLNKPKCIKCGNVARSRCPYQSCKSCCAKAQNPCHIHVLKGNSSFPDKPSSGGSPLFDQQSTESSPSGSSLRVATYRQLSSNFAQFNNLHTPLRSKKPLTRKDAAAINEWRFSKLKEFKESNIELENEAFDRYMQNIKLLEEVFSVNSPIKGGLTNRDGPIVPNYRKRIQHIVDRGLNKLKKIEPNREVSKSSRAERNAALSELIDKLNKARNEEDLKACMEMKARIFNQNVEESEAGLEDTRGKSGISPPGMETSYSMLKWVSTNVVDEEEMNRMNESFCSLQDIENL